MQAKQREFCGCSDVQAMGALARAFRSDNLHVIDLPYRFSSWAMDEPANVGLWEDAEGQLVAWAIMQVPFGTIDYACHPHAGPELHRRILDWADRRAQETLGTLNGHPCWFVMVLAGHVGRIRDLEAAGFICQADLGEDSWSQVLMARSAETPIPAGKLPAGFTVRPLAGESEVEAYVELHRAVFESRNMTPQWRARTLRCPEYVPDLDLVVVGPDGRLGAFCVCWLDRSASEASAQIEPLGVCAELTKLGLGRAILAENLRRAHLFGARRVYVETDCYRNPALRLYESVGFRVLQHVLVYRKDYDGA